MIVQGYTISDLNIYKGIGYTGMISILDKPSYVYEIGFWIDEELPSTKSLIHMSELGMLRIRETPNKPTPDYVLLDIPGYSWIPALDLTDKSVLLDMFGNRRMLLLCPSGRTSIRNKYNPDLIIHVESDGPHITNMPHVKQTDLALSRKVLEVREVPLQSYGKALPIQGERQDTLPELAKHLAKPETKRKAPGKPRRAPKKGAHQKEPSE